jgi:Zn-dependent metalloprotease
MTEQDPKAISKPEDDSPWLEMTRATWDEETGVLREARGLFTDESDELPEQIAERFLNQSSHLLGPEEGSVLDHVQLVHAVDSPAGHKLSYQQYVGDIPVHKGQISVYVTDQGRVYRIANDLRPDATRSAEISADQMEVGPSAAVEIAVDAVEGTERLRRDPEASLVIVSEEGTSHLAWQVSVLLAKPSQSWEVLVDSQSGQVLEKVPALMTGAKR